jgi:hypothetical protein
MYHGRRKLNLKAVAQRRMGGEEVKAKRKLPVHKLAPVALKSGLCKAVQSADRGLLWITVASSLMTRAI